MKGDNKVLDFKERLSYLLMGFTSDVFEFFYWVFKPTSFRFIGLFYVIGEDFTIEKRIILLG